MNCIKEIFFPKRVTNDEKNLNLIVDIMEMSVIFKDEDVTFFFIYTKRVFTNLLAIIIPTIEQFAKNNTVRVILPGRKTFVRISDIKRELFKQYSTADNRFLKIRRVGEEYKLYNKNFLLKDLEEYNLVECEKVQILISELLANINMHSVRKEGYFAGYEDINRKELIISIVNFDITIRQRLEKCGFIFQSDYDAIIWALRKTNTTRIDEESGGLGLYLLRKICYEIDAEYRIYSGNCYLKGGKALYNKESENEIVLFEYNEHMRPFRGNLFTISIPIKYGTTKNTLNKGLIFEL